MVRARSGSGSILALGLCTCCCLLAADGLRLCMTGQREAVSRKAFLAGAGAAAILGQAASWAGAAEDSTFGSVGKVTKSGVKYFDGVQGSGVRPKWGQLCSVEYTLYSRFEGQDKLNMLDSSQSSGERYLFKHGNGRQIKGLEEGVHTMQVGGSRRIVIPASMSYTVPGLGPYPPSWRARRRLNKALKDLEKGGQLVVDVKLLDVFDDEADRGYYDDEGLSLEELDELIRITDALAGGKAQVQALPGQLPASQL